MSEASAKLSAYGAPNLEQLTALVFELASQLHVERVRRLALEVALERSGALAPDAVQAVAGDARLAARGAAELERAMAGIMRVLTEGGDPRSPLRAQSRGGA
jgi:hypothetical protein